MGWLKNRLTEMSTWKAAGALIAFAVSYLIVAPGNLLVALSTAGGVYAGGSLVLPDKIGSPPVQ